MTEDRLAELMVKVVDETATPAEKEELMAHVVDHPELRAELDAHLALRAVSTGWAERVQADLALHRHEARPAVRGIRIAGIALLAAGLGVLGGWGLTELLLDPDAPLWVKLGIGASCAGGTLLVASLVAQRLSLSDPYSEVIR